MQKTTTLAIQKAKSDFIFVIYDEVGCYLKECKTLSEVAKYFRVSKQAITNHLRRTRQSKNNFTYKDYNIEYFDINGIY